MFQVSLNESLVNMQLSLCSSNMKVYKYSSNVSPKWTEMIQELSTLFYHAWNVIVSEEPFNVAPYYLNQWTVGIDKWDKFL